jgi:hypothetical protein
LTDDGRISFAQLFVADEQDTGQQPEGMKHGFEMA